jgi:hypothetical protein
MLWNEYILEVASFEVNPYDKGCLAECGLKNGIVLGHAATIRTLSYAIRFWSKGTKRALFLRHEGFLWVVFLKERKIMTC